MALVCVGSLPSGVWLQTKHKRSYMFSSIVFYFQVQYQRQYWVCIWTQGLKGVWLKHLECKASHLISR